MMLDEHRTPRRFWVEAVNTACYVSNRIYLRVHKKKTFYELMYGRTPKVSHFHVFGCKCFILKKGKKLVDGIFFGYASHSRAYRVLNLETNQIVETCEVTFDETQPRSQLVFECAGDDELGEEIFQEEDHEHGDDEDGGVVPAAEHVHTTSTMVMDGPTPTPTTTNQDQGEAAVLGKVASRREPPRRVQVDHLASRIIGDLNERTTRSRVRNNSHFAHAAFVATFEPKDIGHTLSDHNWVNSMHEELEHSSGCVGLANLGSKSETCAGSHVHLVGAPISFEKNCYRLPFTPPLWFVVSVLQYFHKLSTSFPLAR
jgi:hypothetical protein